jgi:hypothetical protein
MIASLESETPQNAERGIETGIPFEVDSRISTDKRASVGESILPVSRLHAEVPHKKRLPITRDIAVQIVLFENETHA